MTDLEEVRTPGRPLCIRCCPMTRRVLSEADPTPIRQRHCPAGRRPPRPSRYRTRQPGSALDHPHLLFAVVIADRGCETVQTVELVGAEFDLVGSDVLLDPGDALRSRNRGDVVALGE